MPTSHHTISRSRAWGRCGELGARVLGRLEHGSAAPSEPKWPLREEGAIHRGVLAAVVAVVLITVLGTALLYRPGPPAARDDGAVRTTRRPTQPAEDVEPPPRETLEPGPSEPGQRMVEDLRPPPEASAETSDANAVGGPLEVRCITPDGAPVLGAEVLVTQFQWFDPSLIPDVAAHKASTNTVVTDTDGVARFPGIPSSDEVEQLFISAHVPGKQISGFTRGPPRAGLWEMTLQPTDVFLPIEPFAQTSGRVVEPTGLPVAGISVRAVILSKHVGRRPWFVDGTQTTTSRYGHFVLDVPAGCTLRVEVSGKTHSSASTPPFEVPSRGGGHEVTDLVVRPATSHVSGKVIDASGAPVPGVNVRGRSISKNSADCGGIAVTDIDGCFRIDYLLPDEPVGLTATKRGYKNTTLHDVKPGTWYVRIVISHLEGQVERHKGSRSTDGPRARRGHTASRRHAAARPVRAVQRGPDRRRPRVRGGRGRGRVRVAGRSVTVVTWRASAFAQPRRRRRRSRNAGCTSMRPSVTGGDSQATSGSWYNLNCTDLCRGAVVRHGTKLFAVRAQWKEPLWQRIRFGRRDRGQHNDQLLVGPVGD